jgi:plastocyanin
MRHQIQRLLFLSTLSNAQSVVNVDVGRSSLEFKPSIVHASVGTTVNFHFYPGDHSVAQSTFANPCVPSGPDAIYSGFVHTTNGEANIMFVINVTDMDPMWLYCSNSFHCAVGMAMVINPEYIVTIGTSNTK